MLDSRILITGAQGLVGTLLMEELSRQGYMNLNRRKSYEIVLTYLKTLGYVPTYSMGKGLLKTLNWFTSMYKKNAIRGYSNGKC